MSEFVASVPYSRQPFDFSAALHEAREVRVSRAGPQRRVRLTMEAHRLEAVRSCLPDYVVLEPALEFTPSAAAAAR